MSGYPRAPLKDLTAAEIKSLDVGRIDPASSYASRHPKQQPADATPMPLLEDVLAMPALQAASNVCLNIEIKTSPKAPHETFPPAVMADALLALVDKFAMRKRLRVQSFDWRSLVHVHAVAPDIPLSFLTAERSWLNNVERGQPGKSEWLAGADIDDHDGSLPRLIKSLGGTYWSPYFRDLTPEALKEAHDLGLQVTIWTVNQPKDIQHYADLGVDAIITDYPDVARSILKNPATRRN
ncbi:MAG: glycerophosphodiester phosphodiesterase family protein [Hyphomicrobiaceae bacterium]